MKSVWIVLAFVVAAAVVAAQGSAGSVWPQPVNLQMGSGKAWIDARSGAKVDLPSGASSVLVAAAQRYAGAGALFFPFGSKATTASGALPLSVSISVSDGGRNANLSLGIDESYSLTLSSTRYIPSYRIYYIIMSRRSQRVINYCSLCLVARKWWPS
jgi:hypothetical protein